MAFAKTVKADLGPLKAIATTSRALASAHVKVGVLGGKAARKGGPINNPTLGMVHEFGSKKRNIPVRSWLRMPLMMMLPDRIKAIGRQTFEDLARSDVDHAMNALGTEAVSVIDEAFNTQGFGTWPQWSARYARLREVIFRRRRGLKNFVGPVIPGTLLVRTAQLAKSVSYAVVGGTA